MAGDLDRRQTVVDKVWQRHQMTEVEGERLLYVDYLLLHEGARHAFDDLEQMGREVFRPQQVIACADHYAPTRDRKLGLDGVRDPAVRGMLERLDRNARTYGVRYFGFDDPQQGILHVVAPERGITQPGLLIAGADSHTTTHGALGCPRASTSSCEQARSRTSSGRLPARASVSTTSTWAAASAFATATKPRSTSPTTPR